MSGSQTIESATASISVQPDSKSKRYDRQLRLWAASGQSALEAARILVLGADATSAAILKNLVLPGIGHFTLVDDKKVTPADAGNNFFLNGWDSVGLHRSEEVTTLLIELNDQVEGRADTRSVKEAIKDKDWVKSFTVIVAYNLESDVLDELASCLWEDVLSPPLIIVRSASFLAEFYIQYHEHTGSFTLLSSSMTHSEPLS
jgi:amyloid beta precursor protein binding protein 1